MDIKDELLEKFNLKEKELKNVRNLAKGAEFIGIIGAIFIGFTLNLGMIGTMILSTLVYGIVNWVRLSKEVSKKKEINAHVGGTPKRPKG